MAWSEEFGKLHVSLKGVLASIAVCIPFFYIALYLFHRPFFDSANIYLIIAFCFCFALTWIICIAVVVVMVLYSETQQAKIRSRTEKLAKLITDEMYMQLELDLGVDSISEPENKKEVKSKKEINSEKDTEVIGMLIGGGLTAILFLCAAILFAYWREWNFKTFLSASYFYVVGRCFLMSVPIIKQEIKLDQLRTDIKEKSVANKKAKE
jgi:hypothetical protein